MSLENEPIRLQKRESPQDYIDGYRFALQSMKTWVEQQLEDSATVPPFTAMKIWVEQQLATIETVQKAHDSIGEN